MISNSLDIDFIHGDIHGRSCKKSTYSIKKAPVVTRNWTFSTVTLWYRCIKLFGIGAQLYISHSSLVDICKTFRLRLSLGLNWSLISDFGLFTMDQYLVILRMWVHIILLLFSVSQYYLIVPVFSWFRTAFLLCYKPIVKRSTCYYFTNVYICLC